MMSPTLSPSATPQARDDGEVALQRCLDGLGGGARLRSFAP